MKPEELKTKMEITWCPGCPNNGIFTSVKSALANLVNEGAVEKKNITTVTGIGCHAKMYDYLNSNGFYSIHGRVLPTALGIKIGNPNLTVIGFGGDGDTYAEGLDHFVQSCRINANMTMIVHNNQVFALTTGQATPTSEQGYKGRSTPLGVGDKPLNPILVALASGATFVARSYALDVQHLTALIQEAIKHKGFAYIDVLQPCLIYHNVVPYLQKRIYKLSESGHDQSNFDAALAKAREWDYCFTEENGKIPIGIFYKTSKPTFEEQWRLEKPMHTIERKVEWKKTLEEFR